MARRRLGDQICVVTGASSGVGRAIAHAFAERGAKVALLARNGEALDHVAVEVHQLGGEPLVLPTDVADAAAVEEAGQDVIARFGRIDTWVNAAMVTVLSPALEMTAEEFRQVTEVNYLGTVHGTMVALRHMVPEDAGTVIQIGSALAYRSIPLQSAYCGTKAAIRAFNDSIRCELIHDRSRVRVCMLQLPAVNTPQFHVVRTRLPNHPMPVPPIYQPEVIAKAAVYAAEHKVREMWVGWGAAKAILGQAFIPGILDWYLGRKGYAAQQADRPVEPGRPDNLFQTVPFDPGTHGEFSKGSREWSAQLFLRRNRGLLASAAAALGLATLAGVRAYNA